MTAETNSINNQNIEVHLPFKVEHKIGNSRSYEEYTNSFKTYEEAEIFFNEIAPLSMIARIYQIFVRIDNEGLFEVENVLLKEKDVQQVANPDLHIC